MTKFVNAKIARPVKVIEKIAKPVRAVAYKKSVSTSLVFRSLKFDDDGYIGFKVTYSGKGGSFKRNKMTVILIPDVNYHKSYRPIAGALARATKGEVMVCAYNKIGRAGLNEQMIQTILDRVRLGKMKSALFVSENEKILDHFKQKILPKRSSDAAFLDAESGSPIIPNKVVVSEKFSKKKSVKLVKISLQNEVSTGIVSKVVGIVGKLFGRTSGPIAKEDELEVSGLYTFQKTHYHVDTRWNMRNNAHCDLIAKDILAKVA